MDIALAGLQDAFDEEQLEAALGESNSLSVHVALPSLGSAGEHLSIAEDFGEALYVGELLASYDPEVTFEMTYDRARNRTSVAFSLIPNRPRDLAKELLNVAIWFDWGEELGEAGRDKVRQRINDFTDSLPFREVHFPELADSYLLNLICWMSYDLIDDEDDAAQWEQHLPNQPECRFGYIRSAESFRLGGVCFSSTDAWALQDTVRINDFFARFGADNDLARTFLPGSILYDAHGPLICNSRFAVRSSPELLANCGGMLMKTGRASGLEPVSYSLSADGTTILARIPGWTLVDFNASSRILDQQQLETALRSSEQSTERLRECLGRPTNLKCNWAGIADDDFESLSWDVLHECGQYDKNSLKKFGLSRSRDGGRDIEAAVRTVRGLAPRRYIFQRKRITSGRSLSGTAIAVSDVIDQYGADGFGVMTCTTIDATLHDKLDGIARNRQTSTDSWDVLRLERFLGEHLYVRDRYFPVSSETKQHEKTLQRS